MEEPGVPAKPLDPTTAFGGADGTPLAGATVLDYWRWAFSDVRGNVERGRLAEFIVARALGAEQPTAAGWDAYDVTAPWGARVEVKTSGYVQVWRQSRPSRIVWGIARRLAWSDEAGDWVNDLPRRRADVYVFCLLHERERERFDPLDLSQWAFYVVPTRLIDETCGDAKTVGIGVVSRLARAIGLGQLRDAVRAAAPR